MNTFDTDDARKLLVYGVLPVLSAVAFYGTWYLGIENGLFMSLVDIVRGKNDVLPDTKRQVIRRWTGVRFVDDYLAFYLAFFLPGSRNYPAMTLQTRHFITQLVAIQSLLQLQCQREENSVLLRSSLLFTGFAAQTIAPGAVFPLFYAVHLATSSLSRHGASTSTQFGSISDARVANIPASAILSMFVPVISAQYMSSNLVKQMSINVWQFFYLFSELIERLPIPGLQPQSGTATSRVYVFAQAVSTIGHLGVVGVVLLSKIAPGLSKDYSRMSFVKIFKPRLRLEKEGEMLEARMHFLRWDHTITCLSVVLWAAACYLFALPADAMTTSDAFKFGAEIIARAAITGPTGAAAWLLRERDLLLL